MPDTFCLINKMVSYIYKAKNVDGQIVREVIEGDSETSVIAKLQKDGYFPISVTVSAEKEKIAKPSRKVSWQWNFERIGMKNLAVFTRQLSNLINSGMPLAKALDVLIRQTENKKLKTIIEALKNDVQDGSAFSAALTKYPSVFSKLYTAMVKAGELGGMLEIVLVRLAEFIEEEQLLRNKVKSALAYPVVMIFIGGATVIFLLTFVIPRFVVMFRNIGQTLPLPTRILILGSYFLRTYWWIYLPVFLLVIFILRQYLRRDEGKMALDRFKLKMPILGKVTRKIIVARFTRTLGTLTKNGVPILDALKMTQEIVDNRVFSEGIGKIYTDLKDGGSLAQLLARTNEFPPIVADMAAIGEETGSLDASLLKIATSYEQEVENEVKGLTSLLEPAVILIMGLIVGFVVLAMLLPVFEITAVIQ